MDTYYKAKHKLLIPNGPGQLPSSVHVDNGEIFSLDGTEMVDVGMLLRLHQIERYDGPLPKVVETEEPPKPKRRPAIRTKRHA